MKVCLANAPVVRSLPVRLAILAAIAIGGCRSTSEPSPYFGKPGLRRAPLAESELTIEQPQIEPSDAATLAGAPPLTLRNHAPREPWPLTLEEAVRLALHGSEAFAEAGGRVIPAPELTTTRFDPAIQEMDPRFGVPAALSAFDAAFSSSLYFGQNERVINNLSERGTHVFQQDYANFDYGITKRTAVGTQLYARHATQYDANNGPLNLFPSAYETWFEGGFRQPLLQGAGADFNRIAGPGARPGQYNGVVIARLKTDMKMADFEMAVRDLLRDVEQVYWELYYAYREADARRQTLDRAVETWRIVRTWVAKGQMAPVQETAALERVYAAEVDLQNSLSGTPVETRARITGNPQPLATHGGVYSLERRLRYLLGLPSSDGRLIRPSDEPISAEAVFDWFDSVAIALYSRPELRRQQWVVKQREMEMLASRHFGWSRIDVVGDFRWRGFGDDLIGNPGVPNGSAFGHLFDGGTQEWRLGIQMDTPVGNRIGHTAIRHAELQLAREQAIFRNQELQVSHELNAAFNELHRSFLAIHTNEARRRYAHDRLAALSARFRHRGHDRGDDVTGEALDQLMLDQLFLAQQRVLSADVDYFRAMIDYNIAVARLHVGRGSYLEYLNVQLAEEPWREDAWRVASANARRFRARWGEICPTRPPLVSVGEAPQVDLARDANTTNSVEELVLPDESTASSRANRTSQVAPNRLPPLNGRVSQPESFRR